MTDLQAMAEEFVERYGVHVCEHGRVEVNRESCRSDLAALIRTAQAEALREAADHWRNEPAVNALPFSDWLTRRADEVSRG